MTAANVQNPQRDASVIPPLPLAGKKVVVGDHRCARARELALALELAPMRVNTIRPGFIDTDMWNFLPADQRDALRRKVAEAFPSRRAGQAADIGHAAVFLMTNGDVTGTVIEVSGGENLVPSVS